MTLAYWESLQTLARSSQSIQRLLSALLEGCHSSTLWVGNTETAAIPAIEIQETDTEVILRAQIPDIPAENLEIQVTQETVLIQGKFAHSADVEGYFSPSQFQSLIPLPTPVHPETVQADWQDNFLTLRLPRLAIVQVPRVQVNLSNHHVVFCNSQLSSTEI